MAGISRRGFLGRLGAAGVASAATSSGVAKTAQAIGNMEPKIIGNQINKLKSTWDNVSAIDQGADLLEGTLKRTTPRRGFLKRFGAVSAKAAEQLGKGSMKVINTVNSPDLMSNQIQKWSEKALADQARGKFKNWTPTANFNLDLALNNLNVLNQTITPEVVRKYTRGRKGNQTIVEEI